MSSRTMSPPVQCDGGPGGGQDDVVVVLSVCPARTLPHHRFAHHRSSKRPAQSSRRNTCNRRQPPYSMWRHPHVRSSGDQKQRLRVTRLFDHRNSGVLSLYFKKGATVPLTSHAQKRASTIALAIIVTCQLMVVLDATVVNIALVPIKHSLHFSSAGLSWVIDAYSLAFRRTAAPRRSSR
jgi:hypothetical protein